MVPWCSRFDDPIPLLCGRQLARRQSRWQLMPSSLRSARHAKGQPSLNRAWLVWNWAFGGACAGLRPALSVGVENGLGPGRNCYPDQSRHDEAALRDSESDDVATRGARSGNNRSRRRTDDPQLRSYQGSCGAVGKAGATRTPSVTQSPMESRSGHFC
jgi:hypothetical protein